MVNKIWADIENEGKLVVLQVLTLIGREKISTLNLTKNKKEPRLEFLFFELFFVESILRSTHFTIIWIVLRL
jgi:hypothetical protein